jgi:putative membrane-bound dehydrogenase-like protein
MKPLVCRFALFIALGLFVSPAGAGKIVEKAVDTPRPLTPAESATHFQVPEDLRLELVASEPLVTEPVCTAFDEKGNLFVAELHGYNYEGYLDVVELNKTGELDTKVRRIPASKENIEKAKNFQRGAVKLLRDTDGDGVMDEASIWADDLDPCYGIVPVRNGVIAVAAPDIVYLADNDGDGECDFRETLFTGFNVSVLERAINNPRWGKDNWIYVGGGGGGGTITGPHLKQPVEMVNTDFRFKPDGSVIEPVSGIVGTFGMAMNDLDDRFPCSGSQPGIYAVPVDRRYVIRNPYIPGPPSNHSAVDYNTCYRISDPHPWRVKRGVDPNWQNFYGKRETESTYFTGGCGNDFYRARLFPEKYHGNFIMCEPSQNILHRCIIDRNGSGYRGQRAEEEQESEFVASTDQWFRPVNVRVGPDGALYISDMYREIIEDYSAIPRFLQQQYGVAFGDNHGRIWRLVPVDKSLRTIENLDKKTDAELVALLGDSDSWWRDTAQRLLVQRGDRSVVPDLQKLVRSGKTSQEKLHALYTLSGLGGLDVEDISRSLNDEDYAVRVHGLRLAEPFLEDNPQILSQVIQLAHDTDPRIRLQVAMTLGESQDPKATETLILLAKEYGHEQWMSHAILSSSSDSAGQLLAALLGDEDATAGAKKVLQPLAATIGGQRNGEHIGTSLEAIVKSNPAVQSPSIAGLIQGFSEGKVEGALNDEGRVAIVALLNNAAPQIRAETVKLASLVLPADAPELKSVFENATRQALDADAPLQSREEAIALLARAPYDVFSPAVTELLDVRQSPELQLATVKSLSGSDSPEVTQVLLEGWDRYTPQVQEAVLDALFARTDRAQALLEALEKGEIRLIDISPFRRERLMKARSYGIRKRAKKLFSEQAPNPEIQELATAYRKSLLGERDLARGKTLLTKHCLVCHKLGEEGHDVGPNFAEVANTPDDGMLQEILAPSRKIDPQFRNFVVVTTGGKVINGVIASESATSVTLRQQEGKSETILRKDIEEMNASDVSLMPADLYKDISPQDLADLLGYLRSALKKSSPKKTEG